MSILGQIVDAKRAELAQAMARTPLSELEQQVASAPPVRGFAARVRRRSGAAIGVIAEIKRASPSAGPIRPDADPADIAGQYERAGAAAISVLTDERFFAGHIAFLAAARAASSLPLLRKDFIIDPYQVLEARVRGADAILLIVAALDDGQLGELIVCARQCGLDALVEVHDARECERALATGADIVGVNHRDLTTFAIDMTLSARLRPLVPASVAFVAESGISSAAQLAAMAELGADAVLVGGNLMAAPHPGRALAALLGPAP